MSNRQDVIAGALRWRLGKTVITTLADGYIQATLEGNLRGLNVTQAEAMQERAYRRRNPRYTVNTFLIQTEGEKPILIDTGLGNFGGGTAGRLMRSLQLVGITPEEIETILLTHLHLDHSAGLVTQPGDAAFPAATLLVHAEEVAFWLADGAENSPNQNHPEWVQSTKDVVRPMERRLRTFGNGDDVAPHLTSVHLPGHTPGHCGFRLSTEDGDVLFWGDIVHMPEIQLGAVNAGVDADADPEQAAVTRAKILAEVCVDKTLVAGAHLDFPGFGYVAKGDSRYRFIAEQWVSKI